MLPFADYSEITFLQDRGYPNQAVVEAVADQFVAHSVSVVPQEDVDRALLAMGVLPDLEGQGVLPPAQSLLYNGPHTFNHEFEHHGGNEFRAALRDMGYSEDLALAVSHTSGAAPHHHTGAANSGVTTDEQVRVTNKVKTRNVYGLSPDQLARLGQELGVDAVVRGRILEYGLKKTPTIDPAYGLGMLSRIAMGLDWLLVDWKDDGDYAADEPREEVRRDVDSSRLRPFGNPMGPIASLIGGPPNLKSSAIVQVRIYVQDARTGETLWTNRAEVETTPFSIFHFDDQHLKTLFDEATEKAVGEVMQTFFYGRDRFGTTRAG
ncbi:MAG: hypothetical protein IPK07_01555 [Deltaproteobacteria bacterium]|nr:hypothetical protein [Deltaproteobacteria bacterium]